MIPKLNNSEELLMKNSLVEEQKVVDIETESPESL